MKDNRTLFQLTSDMAELEDALYESGGELTPEVEEALALTSQALMEKPDAYFCLIRKIKAGMGVCDGEIKHYQHQKKVLANSEKRLREGANRTMETFGLKRIDGHTNKIIRSEKQVLEIDEEKVLESVASILAECKDKSPYPFIIFEAKVDKTALKEWVKEHNILLAGCEWKTSSSITIR